MYRVGDKVIFNNIAKIWFNGRNIIPTSTLAAFNEHKNNVLTVDRIEIIGSFPYCKVKNVPGYWPCKFFKVCRPNKVNFIDLTVLL